MYVVNILYELISLTTNYDRVAVIPKSILILSEPVEAFRRGHTASA